MNQRTTLLVVWLLLAAVALSLSGLALTGHLLPGDRYILHHLQQTHGGERVEEVADAMHSAQWVAVALAMAAALVKRRWELLLTGVLALISLSLNTPLKDAIARARPDVALVREHPGGYGFPSGHAMTSAVLYGYGFVVVALVWPRLSPLVAVAVTGVLLLIGFDRVYNAAHWPSDVLGGWACGGVLLIAALAAGSWLARWIPAERLPPEVNESVGGRQRRN